MASTLPKSYSYNAKVPITVFSILLFGIFAAVLGSTAYSNDRGLILNGIRFAENTATIFYWILALFSLGFVLFGLEEIFQRFTSPQTLQISGSCLCIPRGFFKKKIAEVKFAEVVDVTETKLQANRFLNLHTPQRKYSLNRAMMPSKDAYEEAKSLICAIIAAQQPTSSEQDVDLNI